MRNFKELITDMIKKPPVLFPLVGLFHVLWLLLSIWSFHAEPFPSLPWLQVLWQVGYAFFWLAASDLRKWGALGYIVLTLINATIYFAVINSKAPREYMSGMFLLDGLFSVFLLFYYKRFR